MSRKPYDRRHPQFPTRVWVVIEQPRNEPKRVEYLPEQHAFVRTDVDSLAYVRGFDGAYGWITGTGTPPDVHFDAFVLTERHPSPGELVEAVVAGVFFMRSGDHKFVTVDVSSIGAFGSFDWEGLTPESRSQLETLYPQVGEGEGWFGSDEARRHLLEVGPTHD